MKEQHTKQQVQNGRDRIWRMLSAANKRTRVALGARWYTCVKRSSPSQTSLDSYWQPVEEADGFSSSDLWVGAVERLDGCIQCVAHGSGLRSGGGERYAAHMMHPGALGELRFPRSL